MIIALAVSDIISSIADVLGLVLHCSVSATSAKPVLSSLEPATRLERCRWKIFYFVLMGRDNLLPREGFDMTQANDLNKSPFKKLKLEAANLILAGFRRPAYASVLQRHTKQSTYACDLLLDAIGRKIQVKVGGSLSENQMCCSAAVHGLPHLISPLTLDLIQESSASFPRYLVGEIALNPARLRLTLLPFLGKSDDRTWVCILEHWMDEAC